jgi:ABC-2 type transport system ATP-binding protein
VLSVAEAPVIRTEALTKRYGRRRGIEDVTFEVRRGEVFGFLGPNGAGKTTTMRTLLDFLRPTSGRAEVFGLDSRAGSVEIHRHLGYLPGELALWDRMRGEDCLRFLASLRGGVPWDRVGALADRLGADLDARIGSLSHGNKQKLGVIQAFMHDPQLLVLDEPTGALDPLVQHEVHGLIREAGAAGRTVFLSSHILPEVEALCDRVGIIRDGRLVAVEHIASLKERALRRLEIRFADPVPSEEFRALDGVRDLTVADGILRCTVAGTLDRVIKAAARHTVVNVISEEPSLEEIFLDFYGESRAP